MKKSVQNIANSGLLEAEKARVNVESTMRVFLKQPRNPNRGINQQYGVYDEEMTFIGDITAHGKYFVQEELVQMVQKLFE
jgi:hypothetical protein